MAKGQRALLPPEDEQHLRQLVATGNDALRRRVQVILDWHEGLSASESAKHVALSENQVRYLLRLYRQKGLDLFLVGDEPAPTEPTPANSSKAVRSVVPATPTVPESALAEIPPEGVTLETLCAHYQVDMAHATHVAGLAIALLEATSNIHRLPTNMRTLLEAAALVHNIAYAANPAQHDQQGRDIILAQPIRGFNDDERQVLACTVVFHRKKVHPDREAVYTQLPSELRHDALALSAILRVADGLDNTQSQTTTIADIQVKPEEVVVIVDGPDAQTNARQSQAKADLWNQTFTTRIRVVTEASVTSPVEAMPILSPGLNSSMSVTRAGRTFVLHTLERIDVLMKHVQSGDMGLLPSLAREASRLSEAIVLADAKDFRKETRWLSDVVEEARLDAALIERALIFVDDPDEPAGPAVAQKIAEWQAQAQTAVHTIDARRYSKLASDLRLALTEDVDINENTLIAFHIGSILWGQLAALRDVMETGTSVNEALEGARRLQDHLIAFRDLLGREVAQVLDMLSPFEGYLAAIRTTQAIVMRLEAPKPVKKGRKVIQPPTDSALDALRNTQLEALNTLADGLPPTWSAVNNAVFRRAFALAVAAP